MIGQQVSTSSTVFLTFSICLRNLKYANLNILTVVRQQQISFALLQSKSAALVVTPSILLNTLKHFIGNIFVIKYWFELANPLFIYGNQLHNQSKTKGIGTLDKHWQLVINIKHLINMIHQLITAKPYIPQKCWFKWICSKFFGLWHGHNYFWPPWSWRLLEAKNVIVSAHFGTQLNVRFIP